LFGAGLDSYYRKSVRKELNIDSKLGKELKVLHEEMVSSRKNKLFAPAYFIDGNNTKQKIHFANYFFTAIVGLE
jgi:predicted lipoprotein